MRCSREVCAIIRAAAHSRLTPHGRQHLAFHRLHRYTSVPKGSSTRRKPSTYHLHVCFGGGRIECNSEPEMTAVPHGSGDSRGNMRREQMTIVRHWPRGPVGAGWLRDASFNVRTAASGTHRSGDSMRATCCYTPPTLADSY